MFRFNSCSIANRSSRLGGRSPTNPGPSIRRVDQVHLAPINPEASEISYRIHSSMRVHGCQRAQHETQPVRVQPRRARLVATVTGWSPWRGFNDTRNPILARVNNRTCLGLSPLNRLKIIFIDRQPSVARTVKPPRRHRESEIRVV